MNATKLDQRMRDCRISKEQARKALNISRSAFYRKRKGTSEFTLGEIRVLMSLLRLESADEIFFDAEVSEKTLS